MCVALAVTAATAGCHPPESHGPDTGWIDHTPSANDAAFASLVKQLTFTPVTNSPYKLNGHQLAASILPEEHANQLDPNHVKALRPVGMIGRVIAKIGYTDSVNAFPDFGFVPTDHSKVVYWWLSMPTDDKSTWQDYFVAFDTLTSQVDSVWHSDVKPGGVWLDDQVAYPPKPDANWTPKLHAVPPDTISRRNGPGWVSCGSGCCN
jgi:hypothetical protein